MRRRSSASGIDVMGVESMVIVPLVGGSIRRIAESSEDLPLPVRPQMTTFCLGDILNETSFRTGVEPLYEALTPCNSTVPWAGQFSGGMVGFSGSSSGLTSASRSRSLTMAPRDVSSIAHPVRNADTV